MKVIHAKRRRSQRKTPSRAGVNWILSSARWRETICLLCASFAVGFGLYLVYQAKSQTFIEVEEALLRKQLVNLNEVGSPAELLPLMTVFEDEGDKQFAAQKIFEFLQSGARPVPNVGALAKVRVNERETLLASVRPLKSSFIVRRPADFRHDLLRYILLFFGSFYVVHIVWCALNFRGDQLLIPVIHLLTGLGFGLMISLSDPLRDTANFINYSQGVAIGCGFMLAASFLDYQRLMLRARRYYWIPLVLSLILSGLLIIKGYGPGTSEAKVNLNVPLIGAIQPVEIIKILIVCFLAWYFGKHWEFLRDLKERNLVPLKVRRFIKIPRLKDLIPVVISILLVLCFFYFQKDLGPALILAFLFLVLYSVARNRPYVAASALLMLGGGIWIAYRLNLAPTAIDRFRIWWSPWSNAVRGGDQIAQSLWTMATGGSVGKGMGMFDPEVLRFLPTAHTDMILSVLGEELGFVGVFIVFVLYMILIWRSLRITRKAAGIYVFFVGLGITTIIALQILLIAGGILDLTPLTGVSSPFLSFGRTSMVTNFIILGVLLSISAQSVGQKPYEEFLKPVLWVGGIFGGLAVLILISAASVQIFERQIMRKDNIVLSGVLTVRRDGTFEYQYNPRFTLIADKIPRGSIYDRNGIPLATSSWDELEVHKQEYEQLGVSIDQMCSRSNSRHYPFGALTFYLLGDRRTTLKWGDNNMVFIERDSNVRLQGYDDHATNVDVEDPRGTGGLIKATKRDYQELMPVLYYRYRPSHESAQGILKRERNIRLSIDVRLQMKVAVILRNYLRGTQSKKGAVVMMDSETGDLLASVSYPVPDAYPTFLNTPGEDRFMRTSEKEEMIDRALSGYYTPGSTFKLVTAIAALRRDRDLLQKTYECVQLPQGRVGNYVRGARIRDDVTDRVPHGKVSMERGVVKSCNAYFAQLGTYSVGAEALFQTANLLGISVAARPNTPEKLRESLPQASYGQGQVIANPFLMARVSATIANGGRMPFGRWVIDDSNQRTQQQQPLLTPDLANRLAYFMRGVVTDGTGERIKGISIPIAGKTGTAELENEPSHSWFTGFAPYNSNAQNSIAFCVIIENAGYGGRYAAAAAGEIVLAAQDLRLIH